MHANMVWELAGSRYMTVSFLPCCCRDKIASLRGAASALRQGSIELLSVSPLLYISGHDLTYRVLQTTPAVFWLFGIHPCPA